jgi:hypothetical protein
MVRLRRKIPKILPLKIKVANEIKRTIKPVEFRKHPTGRFYWYGTYEVFGTKIHIHYQMYMRRMGVHYVNIRYADSFVHLKIKEIKEIHDKLFKGDIGVVHIHRYGYKSV